MTSLLKESSSAVFWNSVFFPVLRALNMVASIVVVRSLSMAEYASYSLVIAASATVSTWASFGLRTTIPKYVPEITQLSGSRAARRFIHMMLLINTLVILGGVVLVFLFQGYFLRTWNLTELHLIAVVFICTYFSLDIFVTEMAGSVLYAFLKQRDANLVRLVGLALQPTMILLLVSFLRWGVRGVLIALMVPSACMAIASAYFCLRALSSLGEDSRAEPRLPGHVRKGVLKLSAFIFSQRFVDYLASDSLAIIVLGLTLGKPEIATLAVGFKLAYLSVGITQSPLQGIWTAVFARVKATNSLEKLKQTYDLFAKFQWLVAGVSGGALVALAGVLTPLLFGAQYSDSASVARIILVTAFMAIASRPATTALVVYDHLKPLFVIGFISILVPAWLALNANNLIVAVFGMGAIRVSMNILQMKIAHSSLHISLPNRFVARASVCIAISCFATWLLSLQMGIGILSLVLLAIAYGSLFVLLFRLSGGLSTEDIEIVARSDLPFSAILSRSLARVLGQHEVRSSMHR